jgi:iron-sulfur cluster insertion protein
MIDISARALDKLRGILAQENDSTLCFRISVSGGGCSGFEYGFSLDQRQDDDFVLEQDVPILIDPMSMQYLQGAEIDFQESLMGSHFTVKNPNATATCGCGSSFAA